MAPTPPLPAWRNLTALAFCLSAGAAEARPQAAIAPACRAAEARMVQDTAPFGPEDTIGDILTRPEFAGYARRLLPWADRAYDTEMPISQIAQLLPYHSELRGDVVLAGLNHILKAQQAGVPVFHELYTEAERNETPSLNEAGLFFFPGQPGAPFALIAPGGGFSYVGSLHEGFPYAMALADQGFNAFVVTYRTGQGGGIATSDMARAIDVIMESADALQVARRGYSVWGSSAGARMAASIGSHGPDRFGAQTTERPIAVVMAYTSHSDLGAHDPPTYAIVGARDRIAPPATMRPRVAALQAAGREVEFRIVPDMGHGFGAGHGSRAEGWITEAADFWQRHLPEGELRAMEAAR